MWAGDPEAAFKGDMDQAVPGTSSTALSTEKSLQHKRATKISANMDLSQQVKQIKSCNHFPDNSPAKLVLGFAFLVENSRGSVLTKGQQGQTIWGQGREEIKMPWGHGRAPCQQPFTSSIQSLLKSPGLLSDTTSFRSHPASSQGSTAFLAAGFKDGKAAGEKKRETSK